MLAKPKIENQSSFFFTLEDTLTKNILFIFYLTGSIGNFLIRNLALFTVRIMVVPQSQFD
ncbi:MAG: hypothetical protein CO119_11205 [Flavobacteriales bacterium CG_4_9_14_3_um_filter_40_17]|nr:MAG: hypothetical protein CO119_11205 [Flavobacteriales bacterium CG_4_9_14_3_um_filter_40_17]